MTTQAAKRSRVGTTKALLVGTIILLSILYVGLQKIILSSFYHPQQQPQNISREFTAIQLQPPGSDKNSRRNSTNTSQSSHANENVDDTSLHHRHSAILPLRDWERASLQGFDQLKDKHPHPSLQKLLQASCHPPKSTSYNISPHCCLGSTSLGGQTGSQLRWKCAGSYQEGAFEIVERQARQFLQENNHHYNYNQSSSSAHHHSHTECDICRIMDLAHAHSWSTIGLIGDSVQNQVFHGLMCELQRRQYHVSEEQDDTYTMLHSSEKNSTSTNKVINIQGPGRTTIKYKGTIRARSPLWSSNDNDSNSLTHEVTIHFYRLHKIPFYKTHQLDTVLNETDILMLGFGLHWNDAPNLQADFHAFFRQVAASPIHPKPLLFHRETTAQHFATPTGSFDRDNPIDHCRVLPLHNISSWRDKVIQQVFRNVSQQTNDKNTNDDDLLRWGWIPFFNFSLAQARLHSSIVPKVGRGGPDCTHFCSTPFLWMPLWRGWRIALEQHVSKESSNI